MTNTPIAVITGGTKGIGKALVESFAAEGYPVVTCARNAADLNALKNELEKRFSVPIHTFQVDMSDRQETQAFLREVEALNAPVDVLINNTGQFLPGQLHTEAPGTLESQIETNLYSAYDMCKGIIPLMKQRQRGHIFNVCSIASFVAYENGGAYCVSKFALYGLSKSLREEMKPFNIRVTSVMPGATLTASWEGVELPEERFMPAEDIAQMVMCSFKLSARSVVEDIVIRPQLGDI